MLSSCVKVADKSCNIRGKRGTLLVTLCTVYISDVVNTIRAYKLYLRCFCHEFYYVIYVVGFFFFNLNLEISRVSAAVELLESVKQ